MTGKPRGKFYDITGQRYGRLTVVAKGASRSGQTSWDCACDCGASVNVLKHSLVAGVTKSCGCFMRERSRERVIALSTTHGSCHTPEYAVWCGMKRRCENHNQRSFKDYGARGIRVVFTSFEDFLSEVGPRPSPEHTIGRIDNDLGYQPGNVRWETTAEQARNKQNTLRVTVRGVSRPLKDHCEAEGVSYQKAWQRIRKYGWAPERALGVCQ